MLTLAAAALTLATAPRVASYDIRVRLDVKTHRIAGTETIRWTNSASRPTQELWFHLYLNAFAGENTTFFEESEGRHRSSHASGHGWGWTHVRRLTASVLAWSTSVDLTQKILFAAPDDENTADRTVARVTLPAPVTPGQTVTIELQFDAQLPEVYARTGFAGDFHLLGQWFPKLGVFEDRSDGTAAWNCHQFHQNSEFYADFGDYRVSLTAPKDFTVGATGVLVETASRGDDTTWTYAQAGVHDFALVVAKDLKEVNARFTDADVPRAWRLRAAQLLGMRPDDLRLPPVAIRVLLPRQIAPLAPRHIAAVKTAIAHYGLYYGSYPYETITIVVPPPDARGAGGMEYPTFITAGGGWADLMPILSFGMWPELVTIHEFGHQYFYGLIATNEFEHAWMDEGFNSYAEFRATEAYRRDIKPAPAVLPSDVVSPWTRARVFLGLLDPGDAIESPAWAFRNDAQYFLASYSHTALVLGTFENLVGPKVFARAMRDYAERYRFRHPFPDEFFAVMAEHAPATAVQLLRNMFNKSLPCDFAVERATSTRWRPGEGEMPPVFGERARPAAPKRPNPEPKWRNEVVVTRPGELMAPVEIELVYADNTRERFHWDGVRRFRRIVTQTQSRLVYAAVDPDGVLLVDRNRINNVRYVEPGKGVGAKAALDVGTALLALLGVVGSLP